MARREREHASPWEPLRSSVAYWNTFSRTASIWWTRREGMTSIEVGRQARLVALVEYARQHSPFYRDAYADLPGPGLAASALSVQDLPVVTKRALMARFDDWVTDPAVTRVDVDAFLADKRAVGKRYLDRYVLWQSSGSTGEPGIYVQDADALATYDALIAVQAGAARLAPKYTMGVLASGGRAALIAATEDHFASIAMWKRAAHDSPWVEARGFSVMQPLPELVAELNAYRPAFLASYPTTLALLADEQAAGRLSIRPAAVWSGGESLALATRTTIERAFGCTVANEYGASECMSIAFGCREGWLHVNADWVLLEPVDRDYRPTPPGEPSHTVLLTNLVNRVQPIIRYDLGDSVVAKPGPCACGNPLPAIQVEGRCDDVVSLRAENGSTVRLLPIALTTVVEEAASVHSFQIVQDAPDRLTLRLGQCPHHDRRTTWHSAESALKDYLARQSLSNVRVTLDRSAPVTDSRSGKLRQVIVAAGHAAHRRPHSTRMHRDSRPGPGR